MDFNDRLDEAHKAVLEMIPEELMNFSDIPAVREMAVEGYGGEGPSPGPARERVRPGRDPS